MSVCVVVASGAGKYVDVDTGLKISAASGPTDSGESLAKGNRVCEEDCSKGDSTVSSDSFESLAKDALVWGGEGCKDDLLISGVSVESSAMTKRSTSGRNC